jgi:hypothetical protein
MKRVPCRGVAEREAIKVAATALESWNPFVKVNANAIPIARSAITSTGFPCTPRSHRVI